MKYRDDVPVFVIEIFLVILSQKVLKFTFYRSQVGLHSGGVVESEIVGNEDARIV